MRVERDINVDRSSNLTAKQEGKATKRLLRIVLQREQIQVPRVTNTDKHASDLKAIADRGQPAFQ